MDEKALDTTVASLSNKVLEVKTLLQQLLAKLEQDPTLVWPGMLDSFSALSGSINTLMKQMSHDKTQPLQNFVFLPLQLSSDHDPALAKSTEGRVSTLHHEIVPDYLRTKLDLDLERHQKDTEKEADKMETSGNIQQLVADHNSLLSAVIDLVSTAREEWTEYSSKLEDSTKNRSVETRKLVHIVLRGEGLSALSAVRRNSLLGNKQLKDRGLKAPSSVRADLKTLSYTSPYSIPKPPR
ncbi:mediator of RNA polymerase II transcription subunit 8-like isoform X2 [Dysidea avara]|uniref:mediator of RNA polymerase II transcription subunit 8-like isoform X2 n=1 Tax=Dysidea avara TaxID=196820 RepID=UPI00331B3087